jgi:hypothetical protein
MKGMQGIFKSKSIDFGVIPFIPFIPVNSFLVYPPLSAFVCG